MICPSRSRSSRETTDPRVSIFTRVGASCLPSDVTSR
jgi:hypothetical protein